MDYFRSPLRGLALAILFLTTTAHSQTNTLADAEIQGRAWAQKILAQQPTGNFDQTGKLILRGKKKMELNLSISTTLTATNWTSEYFSETPSNCVQKLRVIHTSEKPNLYFYGRTTFPEQSLLREKPITIQLAQETSFADSDFSFTDLGLEFLHWPGQKVLKKDIHRSCGCIVLESTNPDPGTNGYSRVVSWVGDDSLGIVEAYAYDRNGKQLKDFYPKDFTKVNGQWQVQTLVMENVQTGSKSRIEFDLKK